MLLGNQFAGNKTSSICLLIVSEDKHVSQFLVYSSMKIVQLMRRLATLLPSKRLQRSGLKVRPLSSFFLVLYYNKTVSGWQKRSYSSTSVTSRRYEHHRVCQAIQMLWYIPEVSPPISANKRQWDKVTPFSRIDTKSKRPIVGSSVKPLNNQMRVTFDIWHDRGFRHSSIEFRNRTTLLRSSIFLDARDIKELFRT